MVEAVWKRGREGMLDQQRVTVYHTLTSSIHIQSCLPLLICKCLIQQLDSFIVLSSSVNTT